LKTLADSKQIREYLPLNPAFWQTAFAHEILENFYHQPSNMATKAIARSDDFLLKILRVSAVIFISSKSCYH